MKLETEAGLYLHIPSPLPDTRLKNILFSEDVPFIRGFMSDREYRALLWKFK